MNQYRQTFSLQAAVCVAAIATTITNIGLSQQRPTRSTPTESPNNAEPVDSSRATSFTATKIKKVDDHSSSIFDLAATPGGKRLLSVGTDGKVFLYDTDDWKKLAQSDAPEKKSLGVRVSPDGAFAFTASDPNEVLIFKLPDLTLLHRIKLESRTSNISCSSAFPMLAVGGHFGAVKLIGVTNGKVMKEVPAFDSYTRVLYSQDGHTLYIAGKTGEKYSLKKWSVRDRAPSHICDLPGESYEMKWGKTSSELCITGAENALVINVNSGEKIEQWKSPDGKIVDDFLYWKRHDVYLTGTKGGNVYFWKRGAAKPISTFSATTSQVHHVVPIGDDRLAVALQQSSNSLAIFQLKWTLPDVASVDPLKPIDPPMTPTDPTDPTNPTDPTDPVEEPVAKSKEATPVRSFTIDTPYSRTLAFNANSSVLAVALDHAEMAFFNAKTGKEMLTRLHNDIRGHYVSLVHSHPDSGLFVLQESYGAMSYYDIKKNKYIRPGGSGGVTGAITWSPDRKLIFSGAQSGFDVASFDLSKRHATLTIEGVTSQNGALARGLAVGPRNVVVTMRADGKLQWFKHTQELSFEHESLVPAHTGGVDVRFTGGQFVSMGNEGELKFWKPGDETPTRTVSLNGKIKDGRFLTESLIATLREGESQVELHTFNDSSDESKLQATLPIDAASHGPQYTRAYELMINRVSISPHGKLLAAVSKDGDQIRVSIYDTANLTGSGSSGGSGSQIAPTLAATNKVRLATPFVQSLDFNATGGALAAATENELLFLNARSGKTVSKAEPPTKSGDAVRFVFPHVDPSMFLAVEGERLIALIDARTGKKVATRETHKVGCRARWFNDGKWLAFTHVQGGSVISADFKHIDGLTDTSVTLSDDDCIGSAIAISPRGDLAAIARVDGQILLFKQVAERRWEKQSRVKAHSGSGTDVVFTSDGLASIGNEGAIKYWKLGTTEPTHTISLGGQLADARFINANLVAVVRPDAEQLEFHFIDSKADQSDLAAIIPFDAQFQTSGRDKIFERPLSRLAVSRNGKTLAACASVDGETELAFYNVSAIKRADSSSSATPGDLTYRNWISADGQYKIEAALLTVTNGVAKLKRKSDGIIVNVPLSKLTKADQAFAKATAPE